ncbi:MAG: hypothetical protein OHK0029_10370 [Armatimonadaceae bacterium]
MSEKPAAAPQSTVYPFRPRVPGWLRGLCWLGPVALWVGVLIWGGAEGARYETSWSLIQWALMVLAPEHAPPEAATGIQVQVTMYQINGALRRVAHVLAYAVLAGLVIRAIQRGNTRLTGAAIATALTLGLVFTGADELHRWLQENRHAKWLDVWLNLSGVGLTLGLTTIYFAFREWERRIAEAERRAPNSVGNLLPRLHTLPLENPDHPTRVLVVLNPTSEYADGRVCWQGEFSVPRQTDLLPLVLRESAGKGIPVRLTNSVLDDETTGKKAALRRVRWQVEIEWRVGLLPRSGMAYSLTVEEANTPALPAAEWERLPTLPFPVYETECHRGDIPANVFLLPEEFEYAASGIVSKEQKTSQ